MNAKRFKVFSLALITLLTASLAEARGNDRNRDRDRDRDRDRRSGKNAADENQTGYSLLLRLQGGSAFSSPDLETEGTRRGYYLGLGGLFSAVSENMILDIGGGWMRSEVEGDDSEARDVENDDGTMTKRIPTAVGMQAGYGHASIRYRASGFHIGPQVTVLFGEDTSFAPEMGDPSANVFLGAQMGWIYRTDSSDLRLALRYDQDMSIDDRKVRFVTMSVDFGIPFLKSKPKVVVREKVKYRNRVKYRDRVRFKKVPVLKYVLSGDLVNFETDKDKLTPPSRIFLHELGMFIAQNGHLWKKIVVEGHADERGSDAYNKDLAFRRARSVAGFLIQRGVGAKRVSVKSFGEQKPLDSGRTSVALARNRRVEVHFFGVTDAKQLSDGLDQIRKRHHQPSTCRNASECR